MISEKSDSANDQSPIQARATSSSGARWYGDSRHTDDGNSEDLPSSPPDYILPRSNKTSTSGDSDNNDDEANDNGNSNVGQPTNEVVDPDEHLSDKVLLVYILCVCCDNDLIWQRHIEMCAIWSVLRWLFLLRTLWFLYK